MKFWLGVWVALLTFPVTGWAASQFYCPDYQSQKAHWVTHSAQMKSVEAAYSVTGIPVLSTNPKALEKMGVSPLAQKFAYYYECSRHVLGHVVSPPESVDQWNEQVSQANCWAANRFYYYEESGVDQLRRIEAEINALPRTKWVFFPGPVREVHFKENCYFR